MVIIVSLVQVSSHEDENAICMRIGLNCPLHFRMRLECNSELDSHFQLSSYKDENAIYMRFGLI